MSDEKITDEELIGLIHEQLDPARAHELQLTLAADQRLAERFEALAFVHESDLAGPMERIIDQAPSARLRETFANAIGESEQTVAMAPALVWTTSESGGSGPPEGHARPKGRAAPAQRSQPPEKSWRSWFGLPATGAFAASVVTGLLVFSLMQENASQLDWQDSVAIYQRLYTAETLNGVVPDPGESSQVAARLTRLSGIPIAVPDLSHEKLTFKRGQILEFNQQPLVQLAYLSDKGVPVAICLFRAGTGDHDIQTALRHGLNTAVWTRDGISTMAIGKLTDQELSRISQLSGG